MVRDLGQLLRREAGDVGDRLTGHVHAGAVDDDEPRDPMGLVAQRDLGGDPPSEGRPDHQDVFHVVLVQVARSTSSASAATVSATRAGAFRPSRDTSA